MSDNINTATCDSLVATFTTSIDPEELIWADFWYDLPNALTCDCTEETAGGGFSMQCSFCHLCDPSGVCANRTINYKMNSFGGVLWLKECFQYTQGRAPDEVCFQSEWSNAMAALTCNATVNDNPCNSCTFGGDGGDGNCTGARMDCGNQPGGEVLDRCIEDKEKSNPHSGIFTIINDNVLCVDDDEATGISWAKNFGTGQTFNLISFLAVVLFWRLH